MNLMSDRDTRGRSRTQRLSKRRNTDSFELAVPSRRQTRSQGVKPLQLPNVQTKTLEYKKYTWNTDTNKE